MRYRYKTLEEIPEAIRSYYKQDADGSYVLNCEGAADGARQMRSNEVLYFLLMRHARERGLSTFDFGRSKVGTGPAAWKKTWGFEGEPLGYHLRTAPGMAARDVNPLSPQYRRKVEYWKKLPEPVANLIGPYLAKGLG